MDKLQSLIWYEKYRQTELSQLALPTNHRKAFRSFIKQGEVPHLLFYGPAGSGKTTTATILISKLASSKLIMNASSEDRGIQNVKTTVKRFAISKRSGSKLKMILYDEADGLTADAQMALKNTIETFQSNCRFIFTANHIDKVIPEIISRCMFFKFDTVPQKKLTKHLGEILEKEEVEYKKNDLVKVIKRFYPDVRSIINNVQSCSIGGVLDPKNLLETFDVKLLKNYIEGGKLFALRHMWANTTDFIWLYKYLFNEFIPKEINAEVKTEALVTVAEYLYRDKVVADREINITACILEIMNLIETDIDFSEPF